MDLLILGKHSDDKGTQLEILTSKILNHLGYKNIVSNYVGNGGQEIDLMAEYRIQSLNGEDVIPVICECKAYKAPVNITDWLKFLGKVLVEETKGNIRAHFIALNGVNGNVWGNFKELSLRKGNISLITSKDLIIHFETLFNLQKPDVVQQVVDRLTEKRPTEFSLAYYKDNLYFLIGFGDGTFSLLDSLGKQPVLENTQLISELIIHNTSYKLYINLEEEHVAKMRKEKIKKFIFSILFILDATREFQEIKLELFNYIEQFPKLDDLEIQNSIDDLIQEGKIVHKDNGYTIKLYNDNLKQQINVAEVYQYLFQNEFPIFILNSPQYDKFISESLLNEICIIQGNLKFTEEQFNEAIGLLKLSPMALAYSLHPDPFLTEHRGNFNESNEILDVSDIEYFFQKGQNYLLSDFKNRAFHDYFVNKRKIVELEISNNLLLKSREKIEKDFRHTERLQIGQLTEEYNSQFVLIRLLNNVKQPWETDID